jgi:hypothetical protein
MKTDVMKQFTLLKTSGYDIMIGHLHVTFQFSNTYGINILSNDGYLNGSIPYGWRIFKL